MGYKHAPEFKSYFMILPITLIRFLPNLKHLLFLYRFSFYFFGIYFFKYLYVVVFSNILHFQDWSCWYVNSCLTGSMDRVFQGLVGSHSCDPHQ